MSDESNKVLPPAAAKRRPPAAGMGRVKGVPNKTTRAVKEALAEAFERNGGVESLTTWAQANPTEFYKLWAKLLPTEISGPGGAPIPIAAIAITEQLSKLSPEERAIVRALALKLEGGE
jgi:hypothetical protein